MKTLVVVPMKDAAASKTRLAAAIPAAEREQMSLALFQRAQDFFRLQFPHFDRLVVTASSRISALSQMCGASVLMEESPAGLNAATQAGFVWARDAGFERLLVVPADIPVWLRAEVDELLEQGVHSPVVIARAHDGGTNALLLDLRRLERFDFRYGVDSARLHAAASKALGHEVTTRTWAFLSHDLDTVDDCLMLTLKISSLNSVK